MKKIILLALLSVFSLVPRTQAIVVDGVEKKVVAKPKAKPKSNTDKAVDPSLVKNKDFWSQNTASPVFVVQNIATEKTRVYKRCTATPGCPHELIFETDTLVGQSTTEQKDPKVFATRLGHFKITNWIKFYEDKDKKFPAWYKSDYPLVPKGTSPKEWLSSKYLPEPQINSFRGAYGWFTAQLGPNSNEQSIHGTYGWGEDKDSLLSYFRNPFVSFIDDPMAKGTTRMENQAVAYMRHLVDVGTDVYRVYALEGYADNSLVRYVAQKDHKMPWDWVLTLREAQKESGTIDKGVQTKKNYIYSETLEEGRFYVDRYPTGLGYSTTFLGLGAGSGTTGNTYQIKRKQFAGVFLVDEGRFVDYEHPKSDLLPLGGYSQWELPAQLVTKVPFTLAQPSRSENSSQR